MTDQTNEERNATVLGMRVANRRRALGLSQDELAQGAEMSRNYISLIECGKARNISTSVLGRLARALGETPAALLGDLCPPVPQSYQLEEAIAEVLAAARDWAAARMAYREEQSPGPAVYGELGRAIDATDKDLESVVNEYAVLSDALDDADYPDDPDPLAEPPQTVPVPIAWLNAMTAAQGDSGG